MADGGVFKCPSCGASLKMEGDSSHVECPYCGNTVMVPASLRPAQAPPPPYAPQQTTVIVVQPPPPAFPPPVHDSTPPRGTRRSDLGAFVLWVLAVVIFVPFFFGVVVAFTNPRLFDEWTHASYGRLESTFGGVGDAVGQFVDPAAVAVDGKGRVYVLEYGSGRVQRFDSAGKLQGTWSVGQYSQCIAADRAGNVYVASGPNLIKYDGSAGEQLERVSVDTADQYIESVAVGPDDGVVLARTGPGADIVRLNGEMQEIGRLDGPTVQQSDSREVLSLAVDGTGQIYALGKRSNEVYKYNFTGIQLTRFGAGVRGPGYAIAVDAADHVFVSDDRYIQVYDGEGKHLGRITLPNDAGPLHSLAFGPSNELYALSQRSGTVYRFAVDR